MPNPIPKAMNPIEFLKTVYLGDRACKRLFVDSWTKQFAIQVDCISRIPEGAENWNFYNDENVDDGWLVFEEVVSLSIEPTGAIPDDFIGHISVTESDEKYAFEISVGASLNDNDQVESIIRVVADSIQIVEPNNFRVF